MGRYFRPIEGRKKMSLSSETMQEFKSNINATGSSCVTKKSASCDLVIMFIEAAVHHLVNM